MQLLAKYPEARPTAAEAAEFLASAEQWSAGQTSSGEFTPSVAGVPGRSTTAVSQGAVRQKEPGGLRSLRSRVATGSLVAAVAAAAVVSFSAAPPIAEEGKGKPHTSTTARPSPTHGTVSATQPPLSDPAAATAKPSLPGHAPKAEKASGHDKKASTDKSSSPSEKPTPTKKPKPSEKPTARTPSPTSTPTPTVSSPLTPNPTQPEEPAGTPPSAQ